MTLYAVVIVIILILLFTVSCNISCYNSTWLQATWSADPDFCHTADLDDMILMIGPHDKTPDGTSARRCYLIIYGGGGILFSRVVYISFGLDTSVSSLFGRISPRSLPITLIPSTDPAERSDSSDLALTDILPEHLTARLDPSTGLMEWYDDDETLYAKFYRDNIGSQQL
jgi:hypothetical protein